MHEGSVDSTAIAEAVAIGIRNQVAHFRHLATHSAGGRIEETESYLFFAGAHDQPGTYTNGVIRTLPAIGATELLARADAFFGGLGRQYYLWAEAMRDADLDAAARRREFWLRPPETGIPAMVRTSPFPTRDHLPGYCILPAQCDADLREYLRTVARNYNLDGVPEHLAEAVLFSLDSLRSDRVAVLLARDRSGAVRAGISTFLTDGCVGLEWAATDPVARGCGLGSALVQRAAAWGFNRGARSVWALGSQQGIGIWRKLGFAVPTAFRRYLAPPVRAGGRDAQPVPQAIRRRSASRAPAAADRSG